MSPEVASALATVRTLRKRHLDLVPRMLQADGQAHWPMDILVVSALNRSINLLEGFSTMIESRNLISAMPLLRLQLDCGLRLSAAWQVDNPHDFAWRVIKGTPIRKIKSNSGSLMTDRYLVEKETVTNPWVEEVYDHTSGYVHLSEQHFFNSYSFVENDEETARMSLRVAVGDGHVADQVYLDTIHRSGLSVGLFLSYAEGWVVAKENPEQARALGEHMETVRSQLGS